MRKLIFQMAISLDGFFEGPNKELDWHNVDEEFNDYAINTLNSVDLLLFGRVTYELMVSYWTLEHVRETDPIVAAAMNNLPKIVCSRTLQKSDWQNTRLIRENVPDEIAALKQQPGKDMIILGGSDLALTCLQHGLIDEYRLVIVPILLGSGKRLFNGLDHRFNLKLTNTRVLASGNMICFYSPA